MKNNNKKRKGKDNNPIIIVVHFTIINACSRPTILLFPAEEETRLGRRRFGCRHQENPSRIHTHTHLFNYLPHAQWHHDNNISNPRASSKTEHLNHSPRSSHQLTLADRSKTPKHTHKPDSSQAWKRTNINLSYRHWTSWNKATWTSMTQTKRVERRTRPITAN